MMTAFIDRLTHKGHILEFIGESYRYCHRLKESDGDSGNLSSRTD